MTPTVKSKYLSILAALAVATAFGILLLTNQQRPALAQQGDADKPAEPELKPEPKDKPAPEPAPRQPEPSPSLSGTEANEYTPQAIPGAVSIAMLTGPELVVVPADPSKARAEQLEWQYIPTFRLVDVKYDGQQKLLTCRIDPVLSEQTRDRVFAHLRKLTGAPVQTVFGLNPVRVQSLVVELLLPKQQKVVLFEVKSGHDISINAFEPTPLEVEDEKLHQRLSANLRNQTLIVRTTHPYSAVVRHSAAVESSMTAARLAFEKVLPKGMKLEDLEKHPLIVDRDIALRLQQILRDEFRLKYDGDPAKLTALLPALDKVLARITVSDVPLHQLTGEMIDHAVLYDRRTAGLDVSPTERTVLKKSWEEMTERRTAFKHAWDVMREDAKKAGDADTWHNTLSDKMKLDARLKVGIGIIGGSASMNLEKEFAKSDEGSKQASRETFEKMKNAGELSQETLDKSYIKGDGEHLDKSAAGKFLHLQRVTNVNAGSFRSAIVEVVERQGKGMLEKVTLVSLNPDDPHRTDALREIELMKKNVETLSVDLRAEVKHTGELEGELLTAATESRSMAKDVRKLIALRAELSGFLLEREKLLIAAAEARKALEELKNQIERERSVSVDPVRYPHVREFAASMVGCLTDPWLGKTEKLVATTQLELERQQLKSKFVTDQFVALEQSIEKSIQRSEQRK